LRTKKTPSESCQKNRTRQGKESVKTCREAKKTEEKRNRKGGQFSNPRRCLRSRVFKKKKGPKEHQNDLKSGLPRKTRQPARQPSIVNPGGVKKIKLLGEGTAISGKGPFFDEGKKKKTHPRGRHCVEKRKKVGPPPRALRPRDVPPRLTAEKGHYQTSKIQKRGTDENSREENAAPHAPNT